MSKDAKKNVSGWPARKPAATATLSRLSQPSRAARVRAWSMASTASRPAGSVTSAPGFA